MRSARRRAPLTRLRSVIPSAVVVVLLGLAYSVEASHFRNGTFSWKPLAGNTIEFTLQDTWRLNAYNTAVGACRKATAPLVPVPCTGAGGQAGVGDLIVEYVGATTFNFGDGTPALGSPAGPLMYLVTSVDPANNWLFGLAVDPNSFPAIDTTIAHTYAAPGNYTAFGLSCCRISPFLAGNAHINNPDGPYRVETIVNVGTANSSPVSTLPPIVVCPIGTLCSFFVPAGDANGDRLRYRLSTSVEASGGAFFVQPGPPHAPNAAAISATGLYTWDTTAATLGPAGSQTYYSTQITIEDLDAAGNPKSKVAVDFLVRLVPKVGDPPTFNNPPEIVCGSTRTVVVGQLTSATVFASDPDAGQSVELNVVGLPLGATMTPGVPIFGNPVSSVFSWTASDANVGSNVIIFTARDSTGQQSLCSLTVNVVPRVLSGRMTGGGRFAATDGTLVSHGFQLNCDPSETPATLQVNWNGNRFHLEEVRRAFCAMEPGKTPQPPAAGFNLHTGSGAGRLNGEPASIAWSLVDGGEPGRLDSVTIVIRDANNNVVLSAADLLRTGNQQAHE
jgi:hypothetical protein